MKKVLLLVLLCLLISATESISRRRRQYSYAQQYGSQYGLYGPGGQGWANNNNAYPNQQGYGWNNNWNWNQGNRPPEWYYNTGNTIQSSILCLIFLPLYILVI